MARGGRRAGKPGVSYGERTDLNANKALPVQAPTGLQYGQRKVQEQSQQQVPIAPPPTNPPPVGAAISPLGTGPAPGELTPLHAPTALPDEPVTAGLPIGAGPGPSPPAVNAQQTVGDLVSSLAQNPMASAEIQRLANYVQSGRM